MTAAHPMQSVYAVQGMTCQGCVTAITRAIQRAAPGAEIVVDLAGGRVSVGKTTSEIAVRRAIVDAGYTITDAPV
jgi:copper chaperone